MGWGITVDNVYVTRAKLATLEDDIDECKEMIKYNRAHILRLAVSTPRTIIHEDGYIEDREEQMHRDTVGYLNELAEHERRLSLLEIIKESDKKDIVEG